MASAATAIQRPREDGAQTHYGRYEIVRKLATGGMGEVFLAKSRGAAGFQKHVVIKKILPHLVEHQQFVDGLVREAKLLVLLDHPNIVQVLDLGRDGPDYFMAMEFVHGYNMATIAHYCAQKRVLIPQNACAYIALQVLGGLEYAHDITGPEGARHNIIHRDVSPQNVLISRDGRVKLTDFGIAKVLNEAEAEVTKSLKGKFRYMAPEAVDGGRIDQRYDLFAAGILLFEGLCRRHLFGGRSDVDILAQVREARVPPIARYHPGVSPELVAVAERALAKDPSDRYQNAADFAGDLRRAIQPVTDNEAGKELRAFIEDLYEREDFPINKPKLPDVDAPDPNVTRSVVLTSNLGIAHDELAPSKGERRPQKKVSGVMLLSIGFVLITCAVAYLAYALLVKKNDIGAGSAGSPVIIKVEKNGSGSTAAASRGSGSGSGAIVGVGSSSGSGDVDPGSGDGTGNGSTTAAGSGSGKPARAKVGRHKIRRHRPGPFKSAMGRRAFARHQGSLYKCFQKHVKPGDPAVSLRVVSTILASGHVKQVVIEPPTRANSPLGRCVAAVAKRIRYPRHDKAEVAFHQPLKVKMQ
ncbi:MAG: serine/threonine protein kinase [Myxococcales bacterium]|nr:serine/threonine protein kinase [Myxococcales bacterium]